MPNSPARWIVVSVHVYNAAAFPFLLPYAVEAKIVVILLVAVTVSRR